MARPRRRQDCCGIPNLNLPGRRYPPEVGGRGLAGGARAGGTSEQGNAAVFESLHDLRQEGELGLTKR